jgi:uncharacterized membrane protein YozB (DUF420 family)
MTATDTTRSATDDRQIPFGAASQARGRVWLALLALIAVAFIAFALPPYLTLDVGRSRIPPPPGLPFYYPLLVAHVVFAAIAMLVACLQIWPWLRRQHPQAHRIVGWIYLFGGVLPAGILGLVIGAVSPFGPVIRASNVLLALLWLICSITGFRMGRQRRLAPHRRWMVRSVTLTMSVITNRVWAVIVYLALSPQLATTFGGNEQLMVQTIAGLSGWLGWVVPLLIVEWWLVERGDSAPRPSFAAAAASPKPTG